MTSQPVCSHVLKLFIYSRLHPKPLYGIMLSFFHNWLFTDSMKQLISCSKLSLMAKVKYLLMLICLNSLTNVYLTSLLIKVLYEGFSLGLSKVK